MSNIIIGIISYLPDDTNLRLNRINKLNKLVTKCLCLFPNQKIYIIAQNWKTFQLDTYTKNIWVIDFGSEPLGIVGARKALRRVFLDYTTANYLIMLDDDCELKGNSGEEYIKQINDNPDCFIEFNRTLLKLFAVSRKLLSQVDFDDINPEKGEGFEDRIFVNKLRKLFPEAKREFTNTGLSEYSISTKDPDSTWYNNQDIKEMLDRTQKEIEKLS